MTTDVCYRYDSKKNGIASKIEWLGRKYRGFKFTMRVFVSQAPFRLIFSSPVLRRVFKVRTCREDWDICSGEPDGRMYRLRWLGFVDACLNYDGTPWSFVLNRGRTPSEVQAHYAWSCENPYSRAADWEAVKDLICESTD